MWSHLYQSVPSWLELEMVKAKKFEVGISKLGLSWVISQPKISRLETPCPHGRHGQGSKTDPRIGLL